MCDSQSKSIPPTVHLICNAHLDPVWQWRWEEGCAETLATFRNAVTMIHEYPDFIFNHNEALLYQWILTYDADLFSEIQRLVRAGRWFISGGWYLQPDVNLPGTESIIRHIAEGRRFFLKYFNVQPRVAYNFDSFGHSGGLPQILRQAGYEMYIHLRPQSPDLELPSDLYRWRGVEGSEIAGYRIAVGLYHTEYDNIEQRLKEGIELALQLNRDVPIFWGIGNHGGGATRDDLNTIAVFQKQETRVKIIHSTPDRFYDAVKEDVKNAPVVEGDLQRIFTGCYTSLSRIKRGAQKSLHRLVQAETMRTITWWALGQEFPVAEFSDAWRDHLFNDFHDILPGSCTEPAEKDALDVYGRVAEVARRLRFGAAVAFNSGVKKSASIPIMVINTNPGSSMIPVEVECMISHRPKWTGIWHLRLFKLDGTEISCQEEQPEALLPFNGWRRKVSFVAELPGMGVAHYYLQLVADEKQSLPAKPFLNFQIDHQQGLIRNLITNEGQDCLAGLLLQPLVVEDLGDSWGTGCSAYRNVLGAFQMEEHGFREIETGAIRTIYESVLAFRHSRIVMHTIAYAQFPLIEFRLRIYWNEKQKRLKLSIPTAFKMSQLVCEVPGGIISRPSDGEEHVHGRWFMIAGNDHAAMGVVNNGQHGLDLKDGEVRLSILRSAAYCHEQGLKLTPYPVRKFMDQGVHDVRLLVTIGDKKSVLKSLPALANWLNAPPIVYAHLPMGSFNNLNHRAKNFIVPKNFQQIFSIKPENISLLACKQSWDGDALILRLQESSGLKTQTRIELNFPVVKIVLNFQPLEIKTLRIEKSGEWAEVNLIHEK